MVPQGSPWVSRAPMTNVSCSPRRAPTTGTSGSTSNAFSTSSVSSVWLAKLTLLTSLSRFTSLYPYSPRLHIHPAPQHLDPADRVRGPSERLSAALRSDLCRILDANFRERLFHALR